MRVSVGRVITQTPAMLFSLWVWLLTGVLAPAYVSVPVTVVWAGLAAASLTRGGQTGVTRRAFGGGGAVTTGRGHHPATSGRLLPG